MFPLVALIQLVLVLSKEQLAPADMITGGTGRKGLNFTLELCLNFLYLKHQYRNGYTA